MVTCLFFHSLQISFVDVFKYCYYCFNWLQLEVWLVSGSKVKEICYLHGWVSKAYNCIQYCLSFRSLKYPSYFKVSFPCLAVYVLLKYVLILKMFKHWCYSFFFYSLGFWVYKKKKIIFICSIKIRVIGYSVNLCVLGTDLCHLLSLFWHCSVLLPGKKKSPTLNSFLHKGLDAYNISDILFLEMPATSCSPPLLIDFIFTKAVYLKLCALARIAAENKGFPNPNGLFTLFKVDCCCVHDVLTVLQFSSLHYFNRVSLCCCILACTVY